MTLMKQNKQSHITNKIMNKESHIMIINKQCHIMNTIINKQSHITGS